MKLEEQVCSLELAKRLKEFSVKQVSLFEWVEHWNGEAFSWELFRHDDDEKVNKTCSAFTVAELGEMLPRGISSTRGKDLWMVEGFGANIDSFADTEADARAKMLIYLLEQKLVKP